MPFQNLISDPAGFFISLLLRLPAILIAIVLHEAAHAYAAYRLGDDTAMSLGRLTLNPLKHFDPMGTFMLIFVGFGWARPVPINPRNFKNPRRDDLIISLAGVTTNFILFILSGIIMYGLIMFAFARAPSAGITFYPNEIESLFKFAPFEFEIKYANLLSRGKITTNLSQELITPVFGSTMGHLYTIITNITLVNLMLAVFNLIPAPPLDGFHVVNNLFFKGPLFAGRRTEQVGQIVLFALLFTGYLSTGLSFVATNAFSLLGKGYFAIFKALGLG
jgi:Zn-dependent protease